MNRKVLNDKYLGKSCFSSAESKLRVKNGIRTDLAIEASQAALDAASESSVEGVKSSTEEFENIKLHTVEVTSEQAEKELGKKIGKYYTFEFPESVVSIEKSAREIIVNQISATIKKLIPESKEVVMVIGLGNWNVTPDALGPKVVNQIDVSRHVMEFLTEEERERIKTVCAIAPGVLGITGIETLEIVKGVCDHVKPQSVIIIDSLAARDPKRISTTIQITDTGISPGSGVGNRRMELSKETLNGADVIAIGIPTVIDANNLLSDTQDNPKYEDLMVTPKEIDSIIDESSHIISESISVALGLNVLYN